MAAQDREQARVYRWWGMVAFWVILYVSGILASVYWLVGGVATQTDVAATLAKLGAALLAAHSGYGIWRAGRSGVAVDPRSLRVRDIWRDKVIAWSDITDVAVAKAPFLFGSIYVPTINVAGDGSSIQIGPMIAMTEARARKRAQLIVELVSAAVVENPHPHRGEDLPRSAPPG